MKVVSRPIAQLAAYPGNARFHPDSQIEQLKDLIGDVGWLVPIVIDEKNEIIAGHCRLAAARRLGLQSIPCVEAKGLTKRQIIKFRLADNRLTLSAEWDPDLLQQEIADFQALGGDPAEAGFSESELDEMFKGWEADMEKVEKEGDHLDGIEVTIKIVVPQAQADEIRAMLGDLPELEGFTIS